MSIDTSVTPAKTASRGLAFYLADSGFYAPDSNDSTVYSTYTSSDILHLNPYPIETTADHVTLSGTVSGSTELIIKAGAVTYTLAGDGDWEVTVPLTMGANLIEIQGTDTNGVPYVQDPPVIIIRDAN